MVDMIRIETNSQRIRCTLTFALLQMNKWAVKNEMNRACTEEWEKKLDPDGIHVLTRSMRHYHRGGQPVDYHYRTTWLCKLRDSSDPVKVTIDIPPEYYEKMIMDRELK